VFSDSTKWSAICQGHDDIRQEAFAYGLGTRWQRLVEDTRAGATTLTDWSSFLAAIDRAADDEQNLISKGDPFSRRVAALWAASGDYVCAAGRCGRSAPAERAGQPPACALFDVPMAPG
jgi:hypothetical protein